MSQLIESDLRAEVLACLEFITPNLPRDDWLKVLTGIAGSGLPDAEQIALDWSNGGESFNQQHFNDTWRSIDYSWCSNPKGLLFAVGNQNGFKGIKGIGQEKGIKPAPYPAPTPKTYLSPAAVKTALDGFAAYVGSDYLGTVKGVDNLVYPALSQQLRTDKRGTYKNLIIPCYSIKTGELFSYQKIFSNGDKSFLKDGQARGSWFQFGDVGSSIYFLFESFVDALVAFDTMKHKVFCGCIFSANSFKTAIGLIKTKYPDAKIIFFCDAGEAGESIYEQCELIEKTAGYMSHSYNEKVTDAYELWKNNRSNFTNELKGIFSYLNKDSQA